MSDARAIEAVTETLRSVVDSGVQTVEAGAVVVTRPPHEIETAGASSLVNLFCYQAEIDPALRNTDPVGITPGETGEPALPLVLHYLLTPYAPGGDDVRAHRMLGGALQALHSHPLLTPTDLAGAAPYSDIDRQRERLRITWQPVDEKDIYSLWSVFQSPYRLSTAFEVRVVLIDSTRAATTPLPVLTRAAGAAPTLASPAPALSTVLYPAGQPAATVGQEVVLQGNALATTAKVLIAHPVLPKPVDLPPKQVSAAAVTVTLTPAVPAGLCQVSIVPEDGEPTEPVYLAVAPALSGLPVLVTPDAAGHITVTVTCDPPIRPGQRASLLLGDRSTDMQPEAAETTAPVFVVSGLDKGTFPTRLRVDSVDSLLVVDRTAVPPVFNPDHIVTVTE